MMTSHGGAAQAENGPKRVMAMEDAFALAVAHFQAGDLAKAESILRQIDAAIPGHPDVLCNLGVIACAVNKPAEAIPLLDRALAARPNYALAKTMRVGAHLMQANALRHQGDFPGAIATVRRLIADDPCEPRARVDLTSYLHYGNVRAELSDFTQDVSPDELGQHLFVAAMPKSGSTFLTNALAALTQYTNTFLTYAFVQNEQELYLPYLIREARNNTVTQQHCRATAANLQIMNGFGIRPVVLVRNIYDIVLSLKDFYDTGAVKTTFYEGTWRELDEAGKADFIIDAVLPWYFQFYVSWVQASGEGRIEVFWQTYEEMIADKPGTLARIAEFCGLDKTREEIAAALANVEGARGKSRFNKGVAGRGTEELTPVQKDRIARLASYYPSVDISPIGL